MLYYQTLILSELGENPSLSSVPPHRSTVIWTLLVVALARVVVVMVGMVTRVHPTTLYLQCKQPPCVYLTNISCAVSAPINLICIPAADAESGLRA